MEQSVTLDVEARDAIQSRRRRVPPAVTSLLFAGLLTLLAFPEVLLGGSLSAIGLSNAINSRANIETVGVYPNPENLEPGQGVQDLGTRAWQLEPAAKFMNRVLYEGESPEWNPYSAGGSLGPETLADMKMSPFVLAIAALGASSKAVTLVTLSFIAAALYCLQQLFTRTLSFSRIAAVGACVVFVLSGWATGRLGSPTAGPYLLFPIVLYALAEYQRVGGPARLLATVGAHAALFATTFAPGIVLVLILVHSVALLLDVGRHHATDSTMSRWWGVSRILGRQALVPLLAILVTAFIWLPNVDALMNAGDEMRVYDKLDLATKEPLEALTVLTPRHFYEAYDRSSFPPEIPVARWTAYLGIAPLMLVLAALPRSRSTARRLLVLLLALMALSVVMHLGIPGIKNLGHFPLFTPISGSYWAALAAGALTLAFGVAIETTMRSGLSLRVAVGTGIVLVVVLSLVAIGWDDLDGAVVTALALIGVVIASVIGIVWFSSQHPRRHTLFAVLAVAFVAIELLSYQNHQRLKRYNYEQHPPPYLTFLLDNVGDERVFSAGRGALYPEWGSALGIRQLETINLMQLPWYREFFLRYINSEERQAKFLENGRRPTASFSANAVALDAMSTRYLVVDKRYETLDAEVAEQYPLVFDDTKTRVHVYENPDAFPRAYVSAALAADVDASTNPGWRLSTAVTESGELLADAQRDGVPSQAEAQGGTATIVEDHHDRVVVDVDADAPGVLVLTDVYHPNWDVSVNGASRQLGRVNDVARGVVVPAGRSTVVFQYHSQPRKVGLTISLLTVGALLVISVVWAIRRRRHDTEPAEPRAAADGLAPLPDIEGSSTSSRTADRASNAESASGRAFGPGP